MNLLLLEPGEIQSRHVRFGGRRAKHVKVVLRAEPGKTLRVGVLGVGPVEAIVRAVEADSVELELGEIRTAPLPRVSIALALPRPKAVSRIVAAAASFGLRHLLLINAWKVDKSYFSSPRLAPERLKEDALLGCEQGACCHPPHIEVVHSFRKFVENIDPALSPGAPLDRIALHPHAKATLADVLAGQDVPTAAGTLLAFGPEGGFVDAELESLERGSYRLARLETGPLKTEVALAAALGQLLLLRPPRQD